MTSDTMTGPISQISMSFWLFDILPSYCTSLTATCSVICKDARSPYNGDSANAALLQPSHADRNDNGPLLGNDRPSEQE